MPSLSIIACVSVIVTDLLNPMSLASFMHSVLLGPGMLVCARWETALLAHAQTSTFPCS